MSGTPDPDETLQLLTQAIDFILSLPANIDEAVRVAMHAGLTADQLQPLTSLSETVRLRGVQLRAHLDALHAPPGAADG